MKDDKVVIDYIKNTLKNESGINVLIDIILEKFKESLFELQKGKKIFAIKAIREFSGKNLKDSKEYVEELQRIIKTFNTGEQKDG